MHGHAQHRCIPQRPALPAAQAELADDLAAGHGQQEHATAGLKRVGQHDLLRLDRPGKLVGRQRHVGVRAGQHDFDVGDQRRGVAGCRRVSPGE
jgi:hypothetical protein